MNLPAAVFATAPWVLGAVRLQGPPGPERDAWLSQLRACLPPAAPWLRVPQHAGAEALDGSLDLAATLATQRPQRQPGLLQRAQGGVLLLAMAERCGPLVAARLAAALDDQSVAVLLLDEGSNDDEVPPAVLLERCALQLRPGREELLDADVIAAARARWRDVQVPDALLEALLAAGVALGVGSGRASWQALCVLRIAAALQGRGQASADDAAQAVAWVFAPRATRLPPEPTADEAPPEPPPDIDREPDVNEDDDREPSDEFPAEQLIEAARAALPPGLLAHLMAGGGARSRGGEQGRAGQAQWARTGGRPAAAMRGEPRGGARLALIDTLRAAAPWQAVRAAQSPDAPRRLYIQRDDLHVQRRLRRRATTTVFAIDASGSQALHRLGEAKGAVELLLADCYTRRDRVAVVGFRGTGAELLLPPTRSLVRARRQLAGLPGGGATPLAAGISAAQALAEATRRGGGSPLVVLLTDGRGNVSRDGSPGRDAARADALLAARALRASGIAALVIDTSPHPGPAASELAQAMAGRCVALPHAQAARLSAAVREEHQGLRKGGSGG